MFLKNIGSRLTNYAVILQMTIWIFTAMRNLTLILQQNWRVLPSGITWYSPLKANQWFGGKCHLHLQGWLWLLSDWCWLIACLILQPSSWRVHVPLKCQLTFSELHGVIFQKGEFFMTTTVKNLKSYIYKTVCHYYSVPQRHKLHTGRY
jgi:hypothetical protein